MNGYDQMATTMLGSYVGLFTVPKSIFDQFLRGKSIIEHTNRQFIILKNVFESLINEVNRNILKQRLGIPKQIGNNESLIILDLHIPLLHNARFPSGFELGINRFFKGSNYTSGVK